MNIIIITSDKSKSIIYSTRLRMFKANELMNNFNDYSDIPRVIDYLEKISSEAPIIVLFPNDKGALWQELTNKSILSIR